MPQADFNRCRSAASKATSSLKTPLTTLFSATSAGVLVMGLAAPTQADLTILGVGNGALDLPKMQAIFRPQSTAGVASTSDPLSSDLGDLADLFADLPGFEDFGSSLGLNEFAIEGYTDTGASTVLIGGFTALSYGLDQLPNVVFEDVGIGGAEQFGVSARYTVQMPLANPAEINSDPANFIHTVPDIHTSIKGLGEGIDAGDLIDPIDQIIASYFDFNVYGMPLLENKTLVMDARGLNQFMYAEDVESLTLEPAIATMLYDNSAPAPAWDPSNTGNPGRPDAEQADFIFDLEFADFGGFTQTFDPTDPNAVPNGPSLSHNPMVGGNLPASVNETIDDRDDVPGVSLSFDGQTTEGSFLFDTGGSISVMSSAKAGDIGIVFDEGQGRFEDSQGVPLSDDRAFSIQVSGVGGTTDLNGYILDRLDLPGYRMVNGEEVPELFTVFDVPIVIADIGITDPDTNEEFILDGVFGMNLLFGTTFIDGAIDPTLVDLALIPGAFNYVTYDETDNRVMLFDGRGDFDFSGVRDANDIDALGLAIGEPFTLDTAVYDLDFDGDIDADDLNQLITEYFRTVPGDSDLDGDVDLVDLDALGQNWDSMAGWAGGDFNLDGNVDLVDLDLLGQNWGFGTTDSSSFAAALAASGVPEPASAMLLLTALPLLGRGRRA